MKKNHVLSPFVRGVKAAVAFGIVTVAATALTGTLSIVRGQQAQTPEPAQSSSTPSITITHAGNQVELPAKPATTVVLDLALLDVFESLGIQAAAVPNGRYMGKLEAYAQDSVPKVGSMFEPDAEAIRALQPDLIIAGRRSSKAFDSVADIAPSINLAFDQQNLVDSVVQTTRIIASLYGKQEVAEAKIERLQESVQELREKAASAGTGLLVFTTSGKAISQGPDSRFGVLFNDFGVQPAMTEFPDGRGVELTAELLQSVNPDWIYVLDRDAGLDRHDTPAQQILDQMNVEQTSAGKHGRIVHLNPYNWYMLDGAGLDALQENVNQLLGALDGAS